MAADLLLFLGLGFIGVVLTGLFSTPDVLVDDEEPIAAEAEEEVLEPTLPRPRLLTSPEAEAQVGGEPPGWPATVVGEQERSRGRSLVELVGLLAAAAAAIALVVAGGGWIVLQVFRSVAGF